MMVYPTKEWDDPQSPVIVLWKTSTQELLQTEYINDKMKKGNTSIIHMGDTILATKVESGNN